MKYSPSSFTSSCTLPTTAKCTACKLISNLWLIFDFRFPHNFRDCSCELQVSGGRFLYIYHVWGEVHACTVHCKLYTVHCTLYTFQCTNWNVHCRLHYVSDQLWQCTVSGLNCSVSLYTLHLTLCTVPCLVHARTQGMHCTSLTGQYTQLNVHCTLYTSQWTAHCTLYTSQWTAHCTLPSEHCTLHTARCTLPIHCTPYFIKIWTQYVKLHKTCEWSIAACVGIGHVLSIDSWQSISSCANLNLFAEKLV